ncbi:MAG: hypothetical protein K2M48_02600, partial [Clostridiales bacterium]|nr:hypothetical protein [Clostridiales bacterium]
LAVAGNTVSVEQQFTKNALNEYIAIINIENTGVIGDGASYTVAIGDYEEEPISLNFGATLDKNPFFTNIDTPDGFKSAIDQGKFLITKQDGCAATNYYLDMYMADAVEKDGAFVKYTQMPIDTIDITTGWDAVTEMEDLKRYLALNYEDIFVGKGEVSVRFAIYGKSVDATTGAVSFTAYNASVISGALTFDLVEADKYYTLPVANINNSIGTGDDGVMYLVVDDRKSEIINAVNSMLESAGVNVTLDADNYKNYLRMKIDVYNADDADQTVLRTKYTEIEFMGVKVKDIIEEWQKEYFTEHGNVQDPQYKIGIRISYAAKPDTAITQYFPRASAAEAGITYDDAVGQVKYEKQITLSKAQYVMPNTGMNRDGNYFEFLKDSVGRGKLLKDGDADYLEIKFYIIGEEDGKLVENHVNYAYLYNVNDRAVIYKNKEDVGKDGEDIAKIDVGEIGNPYITLDYFRDNFAQKYYTVDGYPFRWDDGWTFTSRYKLSENSETYLFGGDWSTPFTLDEVSYAFTKNTQVRYVDGDSAFAFFESFTPEGTAAIARGGIFTNGYVDRVELHFYQGETEGTAYSIYMTYNADTQKIEFYYDKGGVRTSFETVFDGGNGIENVWCQRTWMEAAIKEYLVAIGSSDTFTGDWTMYTVTHLRNGSKMFNNGDENGNVKSDTFEYTTMPVVTEPEETPDGE